MLRRKRLSYRHCPKEKRLATANTSNNDNSNVCNENICEIYLGALDQVCQFCRSKNFHGERPPDKKFTLCCQKGKVQLEDLKDYPDMLQNLVTGTHSESENFMNNIRQYNSTFGFASMGADIKPPANSGPYCFRIHGQIYHRTGSLHPLPNQPRKFAQLYILDTAQATTERINLFPSQECSEALLMSLALLLQQINPYAQAYQMMHEVEKKVLSQGNNSNIVQMLLKQDRNSDPRRYNNPVVNEVAVVFQNADGIPPFERDLVIYTRADPNNPNQPEIKRINILDCNLDPMTYPILFPYGERGWNQHLLQSLGSLRRISMRQYYAYRLMVRDKFNPILNAGKLTQQFVVDSYVKMEANNLNFIRQHQDQLRSELYQGLMDHLNSQSDTLPGRVVILPSTFNGSPRNMQQHFRDAMAIVQKYGKPDLFITMTCNPRWREITENLHSWNRPEHRPDLISRVFKLKLKCLLDDLLKNKLFGLVIAKIYVIEFQKRGLPHAHILLILDELSKPNSPEKIDKIVSAEIPDPNIYPRLHEIVISNMIHTPCGKETNLPCMENGICKKGYPKPYQDSTSSNVKGYPLYRRRDNAYYTYRGSMISNRWVVPYNPTLLLKYNCHINVEICASFQSVKYLFKYVYKGHDCANVVLSENNVSRDEVQTYLDTRYVSAPEACWRLFAFNMHEQSHTVVRLAIHLPNNQNVVFKPSELERAVRNSARYATTLTAWFELNQRDQNARQYLYFEIPEHYRFHNHAWQPRLIETDKIIGRMYHVNPADIERYYLRLMLLHVPAATSFDCLRTVNGILYPTFKDAARELGLLQSDDIWEKTLEEAALIHKPRCLREMFGYLLVLNNPNNPVSLWNKFKESFLEDFCYKFGHHFGSCNVCEDLALSDLNETLAIHGKNCCDYGLREPNCVTHNLFSDELLHQREESEALAMKETLSNEQRLAFNTIMSVIDDESLTAKCFFLDGPGGSGKTYLYKTLLAELRFKGLIVLPTASTGIAANLLKGGKTVHSQYKISIPVNETTVSRISPSSEEASVLRRAALLIIDEATMISFHILNIIDTLLQEVMQNSIPFGGKAILLGGDFRQCLPVVPHAQRAAIVQSRVKYSKHWKTFRFLSLSENIRSIDPDYSDWLIRLGNGELQNHFGFPEDTIEIPSQYLSSCIVTDIFGNELLPSDAVQFSKKAILSPKNEDVDNLNEKVLKILQGECKVYLSFDKIECEDKSEEQNFPIEFINGITPSGMPPHKLSLKVGAVVILLRNLNTKRGLCNGTRLSVTSMHANVLEAIVLTGSAVGNYVLIPRISLAPTNHDLPFKLDRRQFPIKLAFAMTINKSQGQTMDKVGIFLREPVFGHGQLYVAFSRVRRASDVKIQICDTSEQGKLTEGEQIFTKNVVFQEVFES